MMRYIGDYVRATDSVRTVIGVLRSFRGGGYWLDGGTAFGGETTVLSRSAVVERL